MTEHGIAFVHLAKNPRANRETPLVWIECSCGHLTPRKPGRTLADIQHTYHLAAVHEEAGA